MQGMKKVYMQCAVGGKWNCPTRYILGMLRATAEW